MRNKQRPIKSNRHKSVTSMIDCPEISFQREERHGVMRLAFFENNDITPETWKDFDFNTLSTLILNRNIHQDLQERDRQPTVRASGSKSLAGAPASAPLPAHSPQPECSLQPAYSPAPVYVRKPASSSRPATVPRPVNVSRQANIPRPPNVPRPAHISRTASISKPAPIPRPVQVPKPTSVSRPSAPIPKPANIPSGPSNVSKAVHTPRAAAIPQSQSAHAESKTFINRSGQFLCDDPDCGKTFPSLRKLRHHKVVHSDELPFICQFKGCGKRFKRKFGIDLHSTTHFDLDPEMYEKTSNNSSLTFFGRRMQYSMCKPCNQKFKTVHDYQDHMLRHGKEPFKCLVEGCGQTFSIWKSFQKHRASHYFNYYCKMDDKCGHSTSNLQLLKLHIYCCHFRRTLPENAVRSRDHHDSHEKAEEEDDQQADNTTETGIEMHEVKEESVVDQQLEEKEGVDDPLSSSQDTGASTPRRDPRLRRNPPRSSTFGQQDYAAINNGISFAKLTSSPQPVKRARPTSSSSQPNTADKKNNCSNSSSGRSPVKVLPKRACASITSSGSQQSTPEKKTKLPLKVLPKRSAQRLPMSLIAAEDGSTEEDDRSDISSARNEQCNAESGDWETKYKCHLCDYKFPVRFQLIKHLSTHLELAPDMYSAKADAKVIQLTERRRREFYCDKCNLKFEKVYDLDGHMRKHSLMPYECTFCPIPSRFKLAKQYLSHLYEHRFDYRCTMEPDCNFTINRKDALKLHIFRMHLNQRLPAYIENFANMADCNEWTEQ